MLKSKLASGTAEPAGAIRVTMGQSPGADGRAHAGRRAYVFFTERLRGEPWPEIIVLIVEARGTMAATLLLKGQSTDPCHGQGENRQGRVQQSPRRLQRIE